MITHRLQSLLEHAIDSQLKLHCLMLFTQRTLTNATAENVGSRLSRDRWSIQEALDELTACGVLNISMTTGTKPMYCYQPTPELKQLLSDLTRAYEDPIQRVDLYDQLRELALYAPYRADFGRFIPV